MASRESLGRDRKPTANELAKEATRDRDRGGGATPVRPASPDMVLESLDRLKELEGTLHIDKHDLDEVLVQHPDLYYRVAREASLATSRRDQAKQQAAEAIATADAQVREQAAIDAEKLTEAQVSNRVTLHDLVVEAKRMHQRWATASGHWDALLRAFEQRSYAIKDLCAQWRAGYYTDASGRQARNEASDRLYADDRAALAAARRGETR